MSEPKPDIWVLAVRDILAGLQAFRRTHPEALPDNAEVEAIRSLRIRRENERTA